MMPSKPIAYSLFCLAFFVPGLSIASEEASSEESQPPVPAAKHAVATHSYMIQMIVVEAQEDANVDALMIDVHPHTMLDKSHSIPRHSFTRLQCVSCHDTERGWPEGAFDSTESFWRSIFETPDLLRTWTSDSSRVAILSRPQVMVLPGVPAVVNVGSQREVEYFKRGNDGLFQLQKEMVKTGVSISYTVHDGDEGTARLDPLSISVTAIKDREKLKGVNLAIGKPIVTTASLETSLIAELGQSSIVSIESPRGGRVLISLNVRRIDKSPDAAASNL